MNKNKKISRVLSILRVFLGVVLVLRYTSPPVYYKLSDLLRAFPLQTFQSESEYFLNDFHFPIIDLFVIDFSLYSNMEFFALVLSFFVLIGFFTRTSGVLLSVLMIYQILISNFLINHFFYMLPIVILIITGAPGSSRYMSFDSIIFKNKNNFFVNNYHLFFLGFFLSCTYFFAGLAKIINPLWRSGDSLKIFLSKSFLGVDPLVTLLAGNSFIFSWFVMLTLLFLSFGFWSKKTRNMAAIIGAVFHLFIGILTGLWILCIFFIPLYSAFYFMRLDKISFLDKKEYKNI